MSADGRWLPPGIDTSSYIALQCPQCGGNRAAASHVICPRCRGTGVAPASLPPGAVAYLNPSPEETS